MRRHARAQQEERVPTVVSQELVDSAAVAIIATDLGGVVTEWNHAAERLFGWSSAEAIGRMLDIVVPDDRRFEAGAISSSIRRGDEVAPLDTVRHARDGRDVRVHVRVAPIIDADGGIVGISNVCFENTEQMETQRALAASESRYRALVDALAEIVLVTDVNGEVVRAQPSWSDYTGQAEQECHGRGWRDAFHPDDQTKIERQWDDGTVMLSPFALDGRLRCVQTGEYRYCEASVVPRRDHTGRVAEFVVAMTDVHERRVTEERQRQMAERFGRIYGSNVFGICYGEHDCVLDANDAMLEMLGRDRLALESGVSLDSLIVSPALDLDSPFGDGETREYEIRRPDGTSAYLQTSGVSLAPQRGWLAVAVDLTQRRAAERKAEHRALHDPLTGLPNRRLLIDRLDHALARSARQGSAVGVLFCDLDHFKEINDVFGHSAGDAVLQAVSRRVQDLLREGDTVSRAGGDEFVIVLEDLSDPSYGQRIAERVRAAVLEPIPFEDRFLHATCSIGLSLSTGPDDRVEALLSRADDAMYRAKQEGRDQIATGTPSLDAHAERRWVERELRRALEDDEFDVAFQPVIDLRDGQPIGAEALLRWSVDGDSVPTARAIEVAEETGIIVRISDWVLRRACREFAVWRAQHPAAASWKLHINVSARDLVDECFVERMLDGIAAGGCQPCDVCLEITETAMVRQPERAYSHLTALRERGIIVAIDDFGTGYASLGVLRDVPADIVKIDRSFVVGLSRSERDRAIVGNAIDLAHQLGLVVVGEGVETLAQMAILDELGCDQAQGYAFALPRPVDELPLSI
jgi:diguanylate cyclase (GGDEF)-like protein/PAS domain S-box-containing protein